MNKPLLVAGLLTVFAAGCSHGGSGVLPGGPGGSSPQMVTPKSISPALVSPAPMAHTEILPPSAMTSPARPDIPVSGLNWTQIPGTASVVSASPDGSLWVLSDQPSSSPDKYIWHYSSGTWINISGLASQLSVAADGSLWALNSGGGIWHYVSGNWTSPGGGATNSITADASGGLYVLSNGGSGPDRAIWYYTSGGGWVQQSGSGMVLAANPDTNNPVTFGGGGFYILNSAGGIWYEKSGSFQHFPGSASGIAPTTNGGFFVLGYPVSAGGNQVYYWDLNSAGFTAQPGSGLLSISAGASLYLTSSSGDIYSAPLPAFGPVATATLTAPSGLPFTSFTAGTPASVQLSVVEKDVNGKTITGTYASAVTFTQSVGGSNGVSISPATVTTSGTTVTLSYNGSPTFSGDRFSAWINGSLTGNRLATLLVEGNCPLPSGVGRKGYYPCDLQSAYNFTAASASNGSGQTIAIIDAYDDPTAENDLAVYRSTFGLPACTSGNGCFSKRAQDGSTNYPATDPTGGWEGEVALDLDMASAVCPKCHILLVESNNESELNLYTAEDEAVVLGATEISNSWGGGESHGDISSEVHFNHPGIPITASSGDNAYSGGVSYPASSAFVTAVGGTNLLAATNSRGWNETAWDTSTTVGAGSGCSKFIVKPVWQTDTGCLNRMVADVSAVADPNTGVWTYNTFLTYGWNIFGGTSASAPIIAGVYALSGNASTVVAGSYPYSHTSALNDIVSGTTGPCAPDPSYFCTAQTGYDGPTGLGTPNTANGAFIRPMERELGPVPVNGLNYHPGPSRRVCPEEAPPGFARCFAIVRTDPQ